MNKMTFNDMEALVEDLAKQIAKKEQGINYQLRPNLVDEILRLKHELGSTLSRERVINAHKQARLRKRLESFSSSLGMDSDKRRFDRIIRQEFSR